MLFKEMRSLDFILFFHRCFASVESEQLFLVCLFWSLYIRSTIQVTPFWEFLTYPNVFR